MLDTVVSFLKQPLNSIFIVILVSFIIAYYWYFAKRVDSCSDSIKSLILKLKEYEEKDYSYKYGEISQTIYNNEYAKDSWAEYSKTLVPYEREDQDDASINAKVIMYSTQAASDYFTVSSLSKDVNVSFWQNLGSIFTGLGILGTFIGLTYGLSSPELASNDVDTLKIGIRQLLGGVGTAFVTSLCGVAAAIVFNIFHNSKMNKLNTTTNELVGFLEKMYGRKVAEAWLVDIIKNSERQTNAIKNLSSDFAAKFGETMQQGMDISFNKFIESLEPLFEDLREGIEKMSEGGVKAVGETINAGVGTELQGFAKSISEIQNSLSENMRHSQELADATNTKFSNLVENFADRITESSKAAVDNQNKQMTDTMEKMKAIMEEMQATTLETSKKFQESIDSTINSQKDSLNDTCLQIKEVLENVNKNIKSAVDKMIEASTVANTALVKSVEALEGKTQIIAGTFEEKAQGQAAIMNEASGNMKKNLEAAVEKMGAMLDHHDKVMSKTYERFEDGFVSADGLISKTGTVASAIGASVIPVKEAADSLKAQMNDTVEATVQFSKAVSDNTEKVLSATSLTEDNLRTLISNLEKTRDQWSAYSDHFKGVSDEMNKAFEALIRGAKDYNDTVSDGLENVLKQYSSSVTEVFDRIDTEVNEMKEAIEDLDDILSKNLPKRQGKFY